MRNTILIFFLLILASDKASSQWTYDPNNLTIICNATGDQYSVRTIHDGNGGYYTFWMDKRASTTKVQLYGQHVNSNGISMWPANGKQIWADSVHRVISYSVTKNAEGHLYFGITRGATSSGDTVIVVKTDSAGQQLWNQPAIVAGKGGSIIYAGSVQVVEKDSGVYIGYFLNPVGNNARLYINRVDKNGNVLWGYNGNLVPNSGYGGFGLISDGVGGLFLYWRNSNGLGTGMGVRRMTEDGTFLWAGNVNPAAGTSGLGYDYRAISDKNSGIIFTWIESSSDVKIARIDSTGNYVWTPGIVSVSSDSYAQDKCRLLLHENYIYVAWQDNRPPNSNTNTYIQQFDMNGVAQWTANGVRCSSLGGFAPTARMTPGDSGSIIFSYDCNATGKGFYAQKVYQDSTLAWAAPGVKFSNVALSPSGEDYVLLTSSDSGAVAFWSDGPDVFANKVGTNGTIAGINAHQQNTLYQIFPNPAKDEINLLFNKDDESSEIKISISNACGIIVGEYLYSNSTFPIQLNTYLYSDGIYFLNIITSNRNKQISTSSQKFIIIH